MKPTKLIASVFALVAVVPLSAQTVSAPPASEGIEVTVSDDAEWQDLGIAITTFATDQDVPTRASAGSTAQLGRQMAEIISANLRNNGLFKPSGPQGLPQPSFGQVQSPDYGVWRGRNADMLVQG
ncbi:MAG: Tol-Pal system protein TolB, partial [Alphaproteobacteria bacterium]|nr:Tol-Pal system protein TolB [Alphaproteobacteria bacterium]